jgi:hypothetical protein
MINITKIEAARKKLKISKYKMSKRLGGSTQVYYDILKRQSTTIPTLKRIADILNLNIVDLI